MTAVDSQRKWNYRNGGEKKRKWSKGGSGSLAKAEQDKRDEGKEMEDNRRWKERLWGRQGEGACGQEQIKHPVRYPSVPGLEFGQLRQGSWVKGQATRWPEGSVVSVLAGTHMGQDYKVNKRGCFVWHWSTIRHTKADFNPPQYLIPQRLHLYNSVDSI